MNKHICSICGYPELEQPARDPTTGVPSYDVCPSCGCEIGYDDVTPKEKERYRRDWTKKGAAWFKEELKPAGWSLKKQLQNAGVKWEDLA
jgi:rubredoxin